MTDRASQPPRSRLAARIGRGCLAVLVSAAAASVVSTSGQTPASLRVRVLTYNIHHGEGVDRVLDLGRIARVIQEVGPDLVALQEVDRRAARTGSVDQPAELARLTGLDVVFGPNIPLQGGDYGNAVLSRWPIVRAVNHPLPNVDAGEQRVLLEVHRSAPGYAGPFVLWATHLDHRQTDAERVASAEVITRLSSAQPGVPMLLAGDLNDIPTSRTLAILGTAWTQANADDLPTIPTERPIRQIDYVLVRPGDRWRLVDARVLDEAVASDHRPLLVDLEVTIGRGQAR
jgi:endonuclease/exonuclease/phosphatase family metal-dependent hydrolase